MGGGQANSGQASQANNAAMAASAASSKLSDQNAQEQQQQYNYLFGADGKSGSLTPFMDPKSLNVTNPTGVYKTQYTNALQQIGDSYKNARGSLAQNWANRGGSSNAAPSGFEQDQSRQLERDNADANGQAFGTAVGQQYQDALSNFWNSTNIASGQAADARSGALTGAANSGSTAAQIYSTAGQYHQSALANIAQSAAGGASSAAVGRKGKP